MVRGRRVATVLSLALVAVLASSAAGEAQEVGPTNGLAKNVIIFIGDGMGTSHSGTRKYRSVMW